jgi:adenine deaminase
LRRHGAFARLDDDGAAAAASPAVACPARGAAPTSSAVARPGRGAAPTSSAVARPARGAAPTSSAVARPARGAAPTSSAVACPARGAALAMLVARDGSWTTAATLHGLDLEGVASTYTGSGDVLLLGRDPEAMLAAHARVAASGGGMAGGGVGVAMPIFGTLSSEPLPRLAEALAAFEHANDVPSDPPFAYLTTFLTLPALPAVCLTPAGLVDVRAGTVLAPPHRQ